MGTFESIQARIQAKIQAEIQEKAQEKAQGNVAQNKVIVNGCDTTREAEKKRKPDGSSPFMIPHEELVMLKVRVDRAVNEIPNFDNDGWKPFAPIGMKIDKADFLAMGFTNIRNGIESMFGERYEFRSGDTAKHEPPVLIRIKKGQREGSEYSYDMAPEDENKHKQEGSSRLLDFAYFPPSKTIANGWDAAVNGLVIKALDERWFYEEEDKKANPILKNYLIYTFERLQYEDLLERKRSTERGQKPRLKILANQNHAVWNTGLVTKSIYEPIYAFFKKNDGRNKYMKSPWVFLAFDTANSRYQDIITNFPYKPERAQYFDDPRELFYDVTAQQPTLDWDHFIKDNIARLPLGFIKSWNTKFQFCENPEELSKNERDDYYARLSKAIYEDDGWLQFLTTRFRNALDITLCRVAWNYKTAIPVYYPREHKIQLLLPLALEKNGTIDVALVCNHKYNQEEGVNNYEGRTIFTLQMAYNNARLITRPDSDWLMADMCKR